MTGIYDHYATKRDRKAIEGGRRQGVYDRKIARLLQLAPGHRLLDVGAGLGTFVRMALDNGFDATGVEYEKEQCELARESNGVELRNGKIQDVWRELGTFDAICLHHVLEHVESPRLMLKIVDSLLHSGGIALIEVPNQFFNISQEIRYWLGAQFPPPDNALHHLYFFSPRTLRQYADRRRFEIVEMNQFRERRIQLPLWERLPRDLYRWFVERSAIGGGLIIEMYLRKRPDPL